MGARIAFLLSERGWSHAELARRIGISRAAVSQWVKGVDPSLEMLQRAAAALGVSPRELFPPGPPPPRTTEPIEP